MSGTLTVKELINELLDYDMDEPVFIGLGNDSLNPQGSSNVSHATKHYSSIGCGSGVYIHPVSTLVDVDG